MPVVSISVNEKMLQDIDKVQEELGFSGRSEVIRAAARMLIADAREKEKFTGEINSILLLIHNQEVESVVTRTKHDFEDITTTQVHSHLKGGKCLEIFILEGEAERIKELVKCFLTSGKMEYVKLIVA
ncbi:MAG: CopG family ribbon-helix-helix protein [Theionarchaea archaeon]|nr:CopG family ribbon-helix-helix protein [Theionarchaea archaeon]MBU7000473.1 CopG family ribbon-helix-helix protein [Theionarchaea archaeon]MBU7020000.1 CopG family ribbon-helix-helix protein [Theionarchaea archaeon]MBU7035251.1 CopG family ribbon-helix-helix protein [Theionarchaea archaeon]MBU7040570.1 CopG family ribbon-helix-helix protein [Theionarchaea archaeon]